MDTMGFLWLGVTALAALVEAAVPALVSIWFVPGGLAAFLASLLGGPVWLQIALFIAGVVAAMVLTRPLARRLQKDGPASTNADRVLGSVAVVTEEIRNVPGAGRVKALGNSWAARSLEPDGVIPVGERVVVQRIEGVKLLVSRLPGQQEPD